MIEWVDSPSPLLLESVMMSDWSSPPLFASYKSPKAKLSQRVILWTMLSETKESEISFPWARYQIPKKEARVCHGVFNFSW